jgi:hypothetical protein
MKNLILILKSKKRFLFRLTYSLLLTAIVASCDSCDTEDPCTLKTDDSYVVYNGTYSSEIKSLLTKTRPWRTPACPGGSDFQFPRDPGSICLRDDFVNAAVKAAFAAETQWRAGKTAQAEELAKTVRYSLDRADELCSNKPVVGTGTTCTTLEIWPCKNSNGSTTPTTPDPTGSTIAFKNPVYTTIAVTFNGETKTVEPGETVSFSGRPGTTGQMQAETSGKTAQGTQVGLLISWKDSYTFPSSGTLTVVLNLPSTFFFLFVKNESARKINKVYVNYGLQSQTLDNVTIPNDKVRYRLGYYRAFGNSNLRLEGESNSVWSHASPDFKLDFTDNQSYTFTAY